MNIIDRIGRRYFRRRGYIVSQLQTKKVDDLFSIAKFTDYEQYVAVQTEGNKRKINNVWADEKTIDFICDHLKAHNPDITRGLCHGSRNGTEVRWFKERLGIDVIGTDISDSAPEYGLVQWDFHEQNPDWTGQFDFIYTNSHDHAYNPKKAFDTWVSQLAPGGKLIIEHTMAHSEGGITPLDPFGVSPYVLPFAVVHFAEGRYAVTRCIKPDHLKRDKLEIFVFVIEALNR